MDEKQSKQQLNKFSTWLIQHNNIIEKSIKDFNAARTSVRDIPTHLRRGGPCLDKLEDYYPLYSNIYNKTSMHNTYKSICKYIDECIKIRTTKNIKIGSTLNMFSNMNIDIDTKLKEMQEKNKEINKFIRSNPYILGNLTQIKEYTKLIERQELQYIKDIGVLEKIEKVEDRNKVGQLKDIFKEIRDMKIKRINQEIKKLNFISRFVTSYKLFETNLETYIQNHKMHKRHISVVRTMRKHKKKCRDNNYDTSPPRQMLSYDERQRNKKRKEQQRNQKLAREKRLERARLSRY